MCLSCLKDRVASLYTYIKFLLVCAQHRNNFITHRSHVSLEIPIPTKTRHALLKKAQVHGL